MLTKKGVLSLQHSENKSARNRIIIKIGELLPCTTLSVLKYLPERITCSRRVLCRRNVQEQEEEPETKEARASDGYAACHIAVSPDILSLSTLGVKRLSFLMLICQNRSC